MGWRAVHKDLSLIRRLLVLAGAQIMQIQNVLETCLYVDDLAKAERFYSEVLGLVLASRHEGRRVFFRCGRQMLLLFNPLSSREGDDQFPAHGAFGPGHIAFGVQESDLANWGDRLAQRNVPIEKVIDWPGGGRSLYFRDPAGNLLELVTPRIWGIDEKN